MMEGRRAGPPPPPSSDGKPKWRVDLERHKDHAKAVHTHTTAIDKGMRAIREEHERFRKTLELIADGANEQLAKEVLGRRRSYAELMEENQQLMELVRVMEGTLTAIRVGLLKPEDLPEPDEMPNVGSRHNDGDNHPPAKG
jgi:hypothetical protein